MFKHSALSVKESDDRKFVSTEEKTKISEILVIKNRVSDLKTRHTGVDEQLNTLNEYVHNNDKVIYEDVEGSYITVNDTMEGSLTNIEILGNTIQDSTDLSNIKSVGKLREDGLYELELTSCGKNLFGNTLRQGHLTLDGVFSTSIPSVCITDIPQRLKKNTIYTLMCREDFGNVYVKKTSGEELLITSSIGTFNTGEEEYVYIQFNSGIGNINNEVLEKIHSNIVLVEGSHTNVEYKHYISSTSKIILPCQLQKVGSFRDRIIRGEDGLWCVEKNISTLELTGEETWDVYDEGSNTLCVRYKFDYNNRMTHIVCEGFKTEVDKEADEELVALGSYLYIRISNSKLKTVDIEGFKQWISLNTPKIYYVYSIPNIIELPLDTQIQLNSFFGQTNVYIESGDVDGVIKCKVSKSLGGSINSLTNKTDELSSRLTKIETLQEGSELTTSTDKGYVICKDTRDGYIKDIKIEGNTLVNLANLNKCTSFVNGCIEVKVQEDVNWVFAGTTSITNLSLKPKTIYTIILDVLESNITGDTTTFFINASHNDERAFGQMIIAKTTVGKHIYTATTLDDLSNAQFGIYPALLYAKANQTIKFRYNVVEGDHTNNPPEYFEGLLSTGQDKNTIEILGNDVGNLFNGVFEVGAYSDVTGLPMTSTHIRTVDYIQIDYPHLGIYVKGNEDSTNQYRIFQYDENKKYLGSFLASKTSINKLNAKTKYIHAHIGYSDINTKLYIGYGSDVNFEKYKEERKQILYKNNKGEYVPVPALRRVSDTVKDTVEKHSDGKYYYHKRCEEVVLNGTEDWGFTGTLNNNTQLYGANVDTKCKIYNNSTVQTHVINSHFTSLVTPDKAYASLDTELLYVTDKIRLRILKTKASTAEELKVWLSNNPVTVIYELADEELYECNDIELNSYDNETLVSIDSGVIPPSNLEFKTTSHIGNIISTMKEEVDKNTKFREEMTESTTLTKEFDNGYGVFEDTKEGIVSIDKIEGNTLVNKTPNTTTTITIGKGYMTFLNLDVTKTYTVFCNNLSSVKYAIYDKSLDEYIERYTYDRLFIFKPLSTQVSVYAETYNVNTSTQFDVALPTGWDNITFVEGECHINKLFKGLKSTGDLEDSVEVLSNKTIVMEQGTIASADGLPAQETTRIRSKNFIPIGYNNTIGLKNVDFSKYAIVVFGYSSNYQLVEPLSGKWYNELPTFTKQVSYYKFVLKRIDGLSFDVNLFENTLYDINLQHNVKQILYKNSNGIYEKPILRGLPNGVKDTIEKHSDGKYYYHKRCEEITFDGSSDEAWKNSDNKLAEWNSEATISFYAYPSNVQTYINADGYNVLCDKFKGYTRNELAGIVDNEGIMSNGNITVRILRTKLETQDVDGFKKWLQSNPITLVYRLATEEVYECNNLDLSSYDGETSVMLNTSIPAKITAKIKRNLRDTLNSIKDRVISIEKSAMDMFKLLLAGDSQSLAYKLYPEDFENISDNNIDEGFLVDPIEDNVDDSFLREPIEE